MISSDSRNFGRTKNVEKQSCRKLGPLTQRYQKRKSIKVRFLIISPSPSPCFEKKIALSLLNIDRGMIDMYPR